MKTEDFNFELPNNLIAQHPLSDRKSSKLLILHKKTNTLEHKHFYDIVDYLKKGDVLVLNNTKVIPARLFGIKEETNAHVELLLLKQDKDIWECLVGNAKVVKKDTIISFNNGELKAKCIEVLDNGLRKMLMIYDGIFIEILEKLGNVPLPPYIKEKLDDPNKYQTVYAKTLGSAAAPTAGLHFTKDLLEKIKEKGVIIKEITLHVGLGTFKPVDVEDINDHKMHFEYYEINQETADTLNKAKEENRRIITVGTTSTRCLEASFKKNKIFKKDSGETNIFIYPGYKWEVISA